MKNLRRKLKNLLLRKLLKAVTEEEVLANLSIERANNLAEQAKDYLYKDSLFMELKIEMDRIASIKMFRKSDTPDDILACKIMLYTNDIWFKKVNRLANNLVIEARNQGR